MERDTEERLRASLRETAIGTFLVLPEQVSAGLLEEVRRQVGALAPKGTPPVVMTSMDVRRHLRTFLARNSIEVGVMSFQELSDDYTVVPCATLRLGAAARAAPGPALARPQPLAQPRTPAGRDPPARRPKPDPARRER